MCAMEGRDSDKEAGAAKKVRGSSASARALRVIDFIIDPPLVFI